MANGNGNSHNGEYQVAKDRLSRSICAINKAVNGENYESIHIRYSLCLIDGAMQCMNFQNRFKTVTDMFKKEHELSPYECYAVLEAKSNPDRVKNALHVLELILMHSHDKIKPNDLEDTIFLLRTAQANLEHLNGSAVVYKQP
ncbi:hypothetical protein JXB27_00410 [Candidatus Woesearchaeota archaeon]|nr:hypothetical protein [Candidatus Woesearchaeota archaeon]